MAAKDAPNLHELTKEELVMRVQQLETHVTQLRNVIAKVDVDSSAHQKNQRHFDFSKYNKRHVALKILYVGAAYQGFAVQEDTDRTIEAAIFSALLKSRLIESRATSNYHRCGRTDKGVSAYGQVISIDLRTNLSSGVGVIVNETRGVVQCSEDEPSEVKYVHILNKLLPDEIRVLAWCAVDPLFSARFSCLQRTYKYYFPSGNLNVQTMREAASHLEGTHDFRNFCKMDVNNGVVNFIRHISCTRIRTVDECGGGYQMCELTVVGKAFLWHQIRCIVAVLFLIGQGHEVPQIIDELLNVKATPRKPQYTMSSELPLVLFDCQFENVSWIYDQDSYLSCVQHLQKMWTKQAVQTSMLKAVLNDLTSVTMATALEVNGCLRTQVDSLTGAGSKPRQYRPLMGRQMCDSFEERLKNCNDRKKRKLADEIDGYKKSDERPAGANSDSD